MRVNGALVLSDTMCCSKNKRARACSRIIDGNVSRSVGYEDSRDNGCDGVRGEVLTVGTGVLIVIAYEVFEDSCKEVVLLRKGALE